MKNLPLRCATDEEDDKQVTKMICGHAQWETAVATTTCTETVTKYLRFEAVEKLSKKWAAIISNDKLLCERLH